MSCDLALQLTQMTLATIRMPEMVMFYDAVFGTQLQATERAGTTLYRGILAGIPLLLCPNEIAGVEAEQSLLQHVETAGGVMETPIADSLTRAVLRDPNGNTIELIQA